MPKEYETIFLNKQDYILSFLQENIEMIIYSMLCFFAPFMIGHPQFIVGTIVNASLILAALNLKNFKLIPIIILPSLGVISRGIIFGPMTIYLIIMVPFIWIANTILVLGMKKFSFDMKINKILSLIIVSVLKTAFLFSIAYIFVKIGILPVLFLTTMGLFQLYTALAGGTIALIVQEIKKKLSF